MTYNITPPPPLGSFFPRTTITPPRTGYQYQNIGCVFTTYLQRHACRHRKSGKGDIPGTKKGLIFSLRRGGSYPTQPTGVYTRMYTKGYLYTAAYRSTPRIGKGNTNSGQTVRWQLSIFVACMYLIFTSSWSGIAEQNCWVPCDLGTVN